MDATIALKGVVEEFNSLIGAGDFEGAEELVASVLGRDVKADCYLHFQLGRMYVQWNKLTSAINHLNKSAEMAKGSGEELLVLQIVEELKLAKKNQLQQLP